MDANKLAYLKQMIEAGRRADAREYVSNILRENSRDAQAWFELSNLVDDPEQKAQYLKTAYELQSQPAAPVPPPAKAAQPKKFKGSTRLLGCSLLVGIIFLCGILAVISPGSEKPEKTETALLASGNKTQSVAQPTPASTPTPTLDSSIQAIMNGTGLGEDDAEKAFEVIKSVGFERVKKLEFIQEDAPLRFYSASLGYNKDFTVSFEGNEIFGIGRGTDLVFYDRDAGGVLDKITNYTLDTSEEGAFIYLAQEHVKQALKAPSTAEFPGLILGRDEWIVSREKDIVWVQSWVDAQNSFGAMIRNKFTAQYSYSTQELLYLELDNQVVFGSLQTP